MFTGPSAHCIVEAGSHELEWLLEEWKVFILKKNRLKQDFQLKEGTFVLHEVYIIEICTTDCLLQLYKFIYCYSNFITILYILIHIQRATEEQFQVLTVDEDNVQMSKFVKQKLGSFMNGKAFYEFTQKEEDLSYYKEVVNVQKSLVSLCGQGAS